MCTSKNTAGIDLSAFVDTIFKNRKVITMLYEIVNQFPDDMIFEETGPFISLYQPTHKHFPENKQDPIVFKNLVREIEQSLQKKIERKFVSSFVKPFHELAENREFWNSTSAGIAVLASQNKCIVYNLHRSVKEFAVVADSFHIKPLIKAFQGMENYHLLSLSRENFTLYEGNRYGFSEVKLDSDAPRTSKEVLGDQLTDSYVGFGSFGGAGGQPVYYEQGGKKDEVDKDTEKYFRYVDRFVFENYSKPSKSPLILVSLKEYHSYFKRISHNSYLFHESIDASYDTLEEKELRTRASEIIEHINSEKTDEILQSYGKAEADALGSSDVAQVAKAASEGRVSTVLIEADKIIPGKIQKNGAIKFDDIEHPDVDDILDDLAVLVLSKKGRIVVLPKEEMPRTTGVAAIFRYR